MKTESPARNEGGFFAVDHRCWAMACEAGINAAAAYLLHARGTGRDQSTSWWSAQALETYTGISRSRAKVAIKGLQSAGLTHQIQGGTRPRYELRAWASIASHDTNMTNAQASILHTIVAGGQPTGNHRQSTESLLRRGIIERSADGKFSLPEPQWIWLPNEFVTGAADETPPLELLRQSQDVMALRLVVDLYREQAHAGRRLGPHV